MTTLMFLTSKPSLLYLNLNKKPEVYGKHFQKNSLFYLKVVSELRKNLSSCFHHINFIVYKQCDQKPIY